ncbi:MAG TPA: GNAT family N-acetyltransferase [Candidatus Babeliales bacterium]|nr:GNAT family N-acetyltransferase [Candidatus Babeliales bacterium]
MKTLLFLLTIITFKTHTTEITLDKYDAHDDSAICAIEPTLKAVYLKAFGQGYKDHWTEQFAQECMDAFYRYIKQFKQSHDMLLVVAKKNGCIAGWILFLCRDESAIIELICTDPAFQKQGVGKSLIFSIKDYAPEIKSLAVVTRKINVISPLFYEGLGFIKTGFMLSEYNPGEMQGYELAIAGNPNTD